MRKRKADAAKRERVGRWFLDRIYRINRIVRGWFSTQSVPTALRAGAFMRIKGIL